MIYSDRHDAGKRLGEGLRKYAGRSDVVVLGLPRGGVPVGYEVAVELEVPFDVFMIRTLGVPGCEEWSMGAVASGGVLILNDEPIHTLRIRRPTIDAVAAHERKELARRETIYRGGQPSIPLRNKTVILVDDGLTDGDTMRTAVEAIRGHTPKAIIVAMPVAAKDICYSLREIADETVCLTIPERIETAPLFYGDTTPTSDAEVRDLVERGARMHP